MGFNSGFKGLSNGVPNKIYLMVVLNEMSCSAGSRNLCKK